MAKTVTEELLDHVGCGDVDNMIGCDKCDAIRTILRNIINQKPRQS